MAKLTNGFLGNASGKLGNVVFSKWKRINTARTYVSQISDANSPAQKKQRLKMSALQKFLSPLNDSFIKSFNSNHVKCSTPWAKAIKDNMPMVDGLGNINLDLLKLGNEKYTGVEILNSSYDPFIDRLTIEYNDPNSFKTKSDFPITACSMLGVSMHSDGSYSYNTDNQIKLMPMGIFYCSFEAPDHTYTFSNYFDMGQFWLIPLEDYRWDDVHQSIYGNTSPSPFRLAPIVKDFNLDVVDNPIPPSFLDVSYIIDGDHTNLVIDLNKKLLPPNFSFKNKLEIYGRLINSNGYVDSDSQTINIESLPYTYSLVEYSNLVGFIFLYCVLDNNDKQIGRFNRLYHGESIKGVMTPYFEALWKYCNINPLSFKLDSNFFGLYGNIDELCADFISSFKTGSVTGKSEDINFKDFEIVVFSEKGVILGNYLLNDNHEFYCSELSPGDTCYVMVKYDFELIDLWKHTEKNKGVVYYISPESIVHNHNIDKLPDALLKALKPFQENPNNWTIPMETYVREALFRFQTTSPNKYKKTLQYGVPFALDATLNI